MGKLFKKSFWIVCENIIACPSAQEMQEAIAKHCVSNGLSYAFTDNNEVVIDGITHETACVRSAFCRGRYVIKCREK